MKSAYTYILANYARNLFYVGATEDIDARKVEHREGKDAYYSREQHLIHLVYFEHVESLMHAVVREKQIRSLSNEEKIALIRSANPRMEDLGADPSIKLGL
jgi:putative endonuclease